MSKHEWHSQWLTFLIHAGIPVESAENAFKAKYRSLDEIDTAVDPIANAQSILEMAFLTS